MGSVMRSMGCSNTPNSVQTKRRREYDVVDDKYQSPFLTAHWGNPTVLPNLPNTSSIIFLKKSYSHGSPKGTPTLSRASKQMLNGPLHTPATPPQRLDIPLKFKKPHIIQLPQLILIPLLGRSRIRWCLLLWCTE